MIKDGRKIGSIFVYVITAIFYIATMVISNKSVSENLDGCHGFRRSHVILFIIICVIMVAGCFLNIASIECVKKSL